MATAAKLYTLKLSTEQFELLRIFLQYQDLDVDNVLVDIKDLQSQTGNEELIDVKPVEQLEIRNGDYVSAAAEVFNAPELEDEEMILRPGECSECLSVPCVTLFPQRWLGPGQTANPRRPELNSGVRKRIYKKYWKVLKDNRVWEDRRYQRRRSLAITQAKEAGHEPVRVEREIMPQCVLDQVRGLYSNPPGISYMNHQWW